MEKSFKHRAEIVFALSAACYVAGYIKYSVILNKLRVNSPTFAIYDFETIFVSGLFYLLGMLLFPAFSILIFSFVSTRFEKVNTRTGSTARDYFYELMRKKAPSNTFLSKAGCCFKKIIKFLCLELLVFISLYLIAVILGRLSGAIDYRNTFFPSMIREHLLDLQLIMLLIVNVVLFLQKKAVKLVLMLSLIAIYVAIDFNSNLKLLEETLTYKDTSHEVARIGFENNINAIWGYIDVDKDLKLSLDKDEIYWSDGDPVPSICLLLSIRNDCFYIVPLLNAGELSENQYGKLRIIPAEKVLHFRENTLRKYAMVPLDKGQATSGDMSTQP